MLHVDPSTVVAQPDPVLALIEAHRAAYAAWAPLAAVWNEAIVGSAEWDAAEAAAADPGAREWDALQALLKARPTTAAGLWALTAYLPEAMRKVSPDSRTFEQEALDALREGALALGLATVQAEAQVVSAGHVDPILAAIERHRLAHDAFGDAVAAADPVAIEQRGGDTSPGILAVLDAGRDAAAAVDDDAWRDIFAVRPTTAGGLVTLLRYLGVYASAYDGMDDEPDVFAALVAMVQGLAGELHMPAPIAAAPTSDLAQVCNGLVKRRAWLDQGDNAQTVGGGDDAWTVELDRQNAVFRRAIDEPSASASDLAAKARLMLDDLDRFHPEERTTTDDERLMRVILREVIARGESAPVLPPPCPDAALLALGMPFLAAWRDEGAADPCSTRERREGREMPEGKETFDVAHARCSALVDRIAALPATTVEGLGVKALAFACYRTDTGSPAGPMPEPDASSTASDDALLWQIQVGAARVLAATPHSNGGCSADALLPPLHPAAAWAGLPAETRDALGTTLVDLVFQDFLAGNAYAEEDRIVTDDDQRSSAIDRGDRFLVRIFDDVAAALPALFGLDGEHPAWAEDYRAGRLTISAEGVVS